MKLSYKQQINFNLVQAEINKHLKMIQVLSVMQFSTIRKSIEQEELMNMIEESWKDIEESARKELSEIRW